MTNQSHEITVEDIKDSIAAASVHGCSHKLHMDDSIYQFLVNNPVFDERSHAVKYYFDDARGSANILKDLIEEIGIKTDKKFKLLEFDSGYGWVSRHLKLVMPKAEVTSCDTRKEAVDFIEDKLRLKSVLSNLNPDKLGIGGTFNVVFALSFFAHVPKSTWSRWLEALYSKVSVGGCLIFTTQGLTSASKYFGDPEIPNEGLWFKAENVQKNLNPEEYGQTIVTPNFVKKQIAKLKNGSLEIHRPAYWWDHQDLWVVQKNRKKR